MTCTNLLVDQNVIKDSGLFLALYYCWGIQSEKSSTTFDHGHCLLFVDTIAVKNLTKSDFWGEYLENKIMTQY